ncbi:MAG: hypothetical protein LBG65_07415 [Puniceicoccales bacterium]|jgi:hypothetical protein|nr:hypothetical protein [Puniceicoccales bacterium]
MSLTKKSRPSFPAFFKVLRAAPAALAILAAGCVGGDHNDLFLAELPKTYTRVVLAPVAFTSANKPLTPGQSNELTLAAGRGFAEGIRAKGYVVVIADPALSEIFLDAQGLKASPRERRKRRAVLDGKLVSVTFAAPENFAASPGTITAYGRIDSVTRPSHSGTMPSSHGLAPSDGYTTFNITLQKDQESYSTHGGRNERKHGGTAETLQPESAAKYAADVVADLLPPL